MMLGEEGPFGIHSFIFNEDGSITPLPPPFNSIETRCYITRFFGILAVTNQTTPFAFTDWGRGEEKQIIWDPFEVIEGHYEWTQKD